jgi:hypothetical protein
MLCNDRPTDLHRSSNSILALQAQDNQLCSWLRPNRFGYRQSPLHILNNRLCSHTDRVAFLTTLCVPDSNFKNFFSTGQSRDSFTVTIALKQTSKSSVPELSVVLVAMHVSTFRRMCCLHLQGVNSPRTRELRSV